jgi:hypothetical protein
MEYDIDRVSIVQFNSEDYDYVIEGKQTDGEYAVLSNSVEKLETFLEHGIAGSEILNSRFEMEKVQYAKLTINSATQTGVTINEIKIFGYVEESTHVNEHNQVSAPEGFSRHHNYPNPFNSETTIQYFLAKTSDVTLSIFNIQGKLLRVLVDEKLDAGTYRARWDGRDQIGQFVSGGVYFSRIQFGSIVGRRFSEANKLILLNAN